MISRFKFNEITARWLFLVCASVVALLLVDSLRSIVYVNQADEGFYAKYAVFINVQGVSGIRELFREYIGNAEFWFFPNPFRWGYIFLCAFWIKLFPGAELLSLSVLSVAAFFILLISIYFFLNRFYGYRVAFLTGISVAFSPLSLGLARRALPDTLTELGVFVFICLFFEYFKRKRFWTGVIFSLVFLFTLLVKETTVLFIVPLAFYILLKRYVFKEPGIGKSALWLLGIPLILAGGSYCLAAGGVRPVLELISIILKSPSFNAYALAYGQGPWSRYLVDFLALSPVILLLAIGGFFKFIFDAQKKEVSIFFWVIFFGYFLAALLFTKNIRYLIFLDPLLRLAAVIMLLDIGKRFFSKSPFRCVGLLVCVLAGFDFLSFVHIFMVNKLYDPVTYSLLKILSVLP